jgi:signal transduction histidine kinase
MPAGPRTGASHSIPPDTLAVEADPELLRLAISQLLDNACKYSLPGSTVSVAVQNRKGVTEIRVSNEGSSIPMREQHRVFDRFYRGSTTMGTPGSGLGLYVARKIALAHGGTLDLAPEATAENEVSFRLTLPALQHEVDHAVTAS